jgi:hypothetical protein
MFIVLESTKFRTPLGVRCSGAIVPWDSSCARKQLRSKRKFAVVKPWRIRQELLDE